MKALSRREVLQAASLVSLLCDAGVARGIEGAPALPDKANFTLDGTYLDAAYTHPFGRAASAAASSYQELRKREPQGVSPRRNARQAAVERFARLINADAMDVAVVPSTMEAENLVSASLGVGPHAGVITDIGHYDASLVLYGELHRRGAPLGVVRPRAGRIDLADIKALLTRDIRLIAVSAVSSVTGFAYDLAELSALAHRAGAFVYVDLIQAAGAMSVDVKASQVDFMGCGTYKWLMGDFGTAFLYVSPRTLDHLKRVQVGWRQVRQQESHVLPFETPGPDVGPYELADGAAGLFEVSTPAWGALATVAGSLDYIQGLGVEAIAQYRRPLLERLHEKLPPLGFEPLSHEAGNGPVAAFAYQGARRFADRLQAEKIRISVYDHRIRVSPSVYNTLDDIDHLVDVLSSPA
jgi:selenocysteine lyase/cysteine desulfurase